MPDKVTHVTRNINPITLDKGELKIANTALRPQSDGDAGHVISAVAVDLPQRAQRSLSLPCVLGEFRG